MPDFVHLHVHSDFSTLDGACEACRLAEQTKALGMKCIALTDHGTVSGIPAFYKAVKAADLKPIVGCEMYLAGDSRLKKVSDANPTHHMGLIARSEAGYRNLMLLSTDAQRVGFHYKPRTDLETVAQHKEGLIAFSGCMQGMIPQLILKGRMQEARSVTARMIDIFGKDSFFIELQNHGIAEQTKLIGPLLAIAREFGLRTIASNDVHYLMEGHASAHDAMLCIQTGSKIADQDRMRYEPRQFWLKSPEEMARTFAEIPEAVSNTQLVADMVDCPLDFKGRHYPTFDAPMGYANGAEYLAQLCAEGLAERYNADYFKEIGIARPPAGRAVRVARDPHGEAKLVAARLKHELDVISRTGFTDYFLVVNDFVSWAKNHGIPVGPGRGSGAGCMVAYTLGITDIDPHKYGLLFERFLNPDRVSPPDLDIDFAKTRRGEVIEYVRQKYGEDCVSGIITFNTLGAKGVMRDLCRVHSVPLTDADRIAKMISDAPGTTLEGTHSENADFRDVVASDPTFAEIYKEAAVLEGLNRNGGRHASGLLIASTPLERIVPMVRYQDEGEMIAGYDGDTVSELGLLKMDMLGLKTLDVIADTVDHVRRGAKGHHDFDIRRIPLDDEETFALLRTGRTLGVFQFESPGMRSLCRQINLSQFEEISAANALFRPGPMDLIPDYVRGKKDPSTVSYMHPLLEPICRETYGIMVYQEQVMQGAQAVAGFTLAQSDLLRRAMGKKKPEEMVKQRSVFVDGASKVNRIPADQANKIFDTLEKFAGYGFNKSHSVGYAKLAYQTAYLKAHFPAEFMAALLTSEVSDIEKCAVYCQEARTMGLDVLPPSVNASGAAFLPEGDGVRYGLNGIKTVGEDAADSIVAARTSNGPFISLQDFVARVDKKQVGKRTLEALIKTGAFGSIEPIPGKLLSNLDSAMANAADAKKSKDSGQSLLFDMPQEEAPKQDGAPAIEFSRADALAAEKNYFGFYLSGHPLDDVMPLVQAVSTHLPMDLQAAPDKTGFRLCGLVSELVQKTRKKDGAHWGAFVLDTPHGGYPLHAYSEVYVRDSALIRGDRAVVLSGKVMRGEDGSRLVVDKVSDLEAEAPVLISAVALNVEGPAAGNFTTRVEALATRAPGDVKLVVGDRSGRFQSEHYLRMGLATFRAITSHEAVLSDSTTVLAVEFVPEKRPFRDPLAPRRPGRERVFS